MTNGLPQALSSLEPIPSDRSDKAGRGAETKHHVLVIDDEASIRELLSRYLLKRGYVVSTVATAAEALEVARTQLDLVVLDLVLAEEDGLELLSELKRRDPGLPVVIWTGQGYEEDLLQRALALGAAGYVSKALRLDQLLMEVHRILNHPRLPRHPAA